MTIASPIQRLLKFEEYLAYDDGTNNRYELLRGRLLLMTPPTVRHLLIAKLIERILDAEISRLKLALVTLREAGVQTEVDSVRLADVCVVTEEEAVELMDRTAVFRVPARLAVEIVSPSSVKRDYEEKPPEYANKGIPEYWIVDPMKTSVTVFLLINGRYESTVFTGTQQIISRLFPELVVTVEQILTSR
ncbi:MULTISPECIES: Uma2 family endonuclease [Nostocales]|uniref:Uma2 family endonuclease n=2 Tax=Nostocales TaxID=1161 RepID=A0A0C1NCR8_9CYAN|nr:Uma2 family endonuclease [Tolypothrix bouteillei]KAF3886519.1 Uma2 family endonuclease [Tolypothrix bouteillei VB521301]